MVKYILSCTRWGLLLQLPVLASPQRRKSAFSNLLFCSSAKLKLLMHPSYRAIETKEYVKQMEIHKAAEEIPLVPNVLWGHSVLEVFSVLNYNSDGFHVPTIVKKKHQNRISDYWYLFLTGVVLIGWILDGCSVLKCCGSELIHLPWILWSGVLFHMVCDRLAYLHSTHT